MLFIPLWKLRKVSLLFLENLILKFSFPCVCGGGVRVRKRERRERETGFYQLKLDPSDCWNKATGKQASK